MRSSSGSSGPAAAPLDEAATRALCAVVDPDPWLDALPVAALAALFDRALARGSERTVLELLDLLRRPALLRRIEPGDRNAWADRSLVGIEATALTVGPLFRGRAEKYGSRILFRFRRGGRGRSLTWKFYSTSDGRSVEWSTTGLQNKIDPPDPLYEENKDLKKGEIRQVDWAVEGADVTVVRTVVRNGQVVHEDVFVTHYQPWRAVYEYGPGTELPKDAKDEAW